MEQLIKQNLIDTIRLYLPEEFTLENHPVRKNTGAERDAVFLVGKEKTGVSPVVYLEDYLEELQSGRETKDTAREIVRQLLSFMPSSHQQRNLYESLWHFEKAKDRIIFRLLSGTRHRDFLRDCPGRPYLDLLVSYAVLMEREDMDGYGLAQVKNPLAEHWGVSEEELFRLACRNTEKRLGKLLKPLSDYAPLITVPEESPGLYCLTNDAGFYGAGLILYPEILRNFSEEQGSDILIVPSSVHEVILIPRKDACPEAELNRIIREVNGMLNDEEILSDHAYLYRRSTGTTESLL